MSPAAATADRLHGGEVRALRRAVCRRSSSRRITKRGQKGAVPIDLPARDRERHRRLPREVRRRVGRRIRRDRARRGRRRGGSRLPRSGADDVTLPTRVVRRHRVGVRPRREAGRGQSNGGMTGIREGLGAGTGRARACYVVGLAGDRRPAKGRDSPQRETGGSREGSPGAVLSTLTLIVTDLAVPRLSVAVAWIT